MEVDDINEIENLDEYFDYIEYQFRLIKEREVLYIMR